jgi:hypothetical protein
MVLTGVSMISRHVVGCHLRLKSMMAFLNGNIYNEMEVLGLVASTSKVAA